MVEIHSARNAPSLYGGIVTSYARVAVDGIDGSGKTTTVGALSERLSQTGVRVALADRSGAHSSAIISALTSMIKASDGGIAPLTPEADGLLRIARVQERLALATSAKADIALLDRWLVTDLALLDESSFDALRPAVAQLVRETPDTLTVVLEAPFEVTWARILQRSESQLSPKERLGKAHNSRLHARTSLGIERFQQCGGELVRVDSTAAIDDVVDRIMGYLSLPV